MSKVSKSTPLMIDSENMITQRNREQYSGLPCEQVTKKGILVFHVTSLISEIKFTRPAKLSMSLRRCNMN